jgi:hypothetical protein
MKLFSSVPQLSFKGKVAFVPELVKWLIASNLYHKTRLGSLYVHAPFTTTCPTAHVCAELPPTKQSSTNTRKISIRDNERAFIHARQELYIFLISNQKYGATQLH